jgi:hypothetical protein
MKGEAFVVGNDVESETESSGVRTLKSEIGSRMRVVDAEKEGEWSWKRELTGHFGNNSPGLRGMFFFLALLCLVTLLVMLLTLCCRHFQEPATWTARGPAL